jgi:Parvulin-like peptidyl-prolyl isomerase
MDIRHLLLALSLCTGFLFPAPEAAVKQPGREQVVDLDWIVAVVNDDVILMSELKEDLRTVREKLREQRTRIPPDEILRRQVLEQAIVTRLQLQLAEHTGIRVDDETLNRAVRGIASQNGLTLSEFRDVLEYDGYSFAKFRENVRNELILTRLRQQQVDNNIQVTDREVENFLANQVVHGSSDSEYHLSHILVALPEAAAPEQIQVARNKAERIRDQLLAGADFQEMAVAYSDGQQALQGGDLDWRKAEQLPTLFADLVAHMQPGTISELIRSSSGFHIIKLLDVRGGSKHMVDQTHARHILIRTNELMSNEEARIRLEQLRDRILDGEDFAQLARAHSDDTASATRGGDLGWVNPGDLEARFEEQMKKLLPGELSLPFETQFGWHIVQVLAHREHDSTEEFQHAKAREFIRKRKTEEELQLWLRRLRDEAYVEYRLDDDQQG